jgi:hypothetical protein
MFKCNRRELSKFRSGNYDRRASNRPATAPANLAKEVR